MSKVEIIEVTSENIENYRSDLELMFIENTYKFHYPDKEVDMAYIDEKIEKLKKFTGEGNTYFLGAFVDGSLAGFIWLYKRDFMTYKRMIINSFFVGEKHRSLGLGKELMERAYDKARSEGCEEMSTHYAVVNDRAGKFYLANGFEEKRVEVVRKL